MKEEILNKNQDIEDDFPALDNEEILSEEEPVTSPETETEEKAEESFQNEEPVTAPDSNSRQNRVKRKRMSTAKKILITVGVIVGLAAAAYLGGAAYYSTHFFYGTKINGFNCSNMTVEEAKQAITSGIENYTYTLYERGNKTESITGADAEMKLESIGDLNEPKQKQNSFQWFFDKKNLKQSINIIVTLNEELLSEKVNALNCVTENAQKMEGATSLVVYEDGKFVVDQEKGEEEDGTAVVVSAVPPLAPKDQPKTKIDGDKNIVGVSRLQESVRAGMYGLYPDMNLDTEGCYVTMSEESTMKQALDTMNRYVSTKVSYLYGDETIPLDGGSIHQWVSVDDNYNVYLDEDGVAEFVDELAAKYNTVGSNRTLTTTNGETVTVYGGDYGWWVDEEDETAALCEIIRNGEETSREPIYRQKAASHGSIDIGNTYVEISLSAQHLWFYKDGSVIVSSDFVSGNPYAGNATPTGTYALTYKERDATLVGEGYSSPVSFWMPFNGGVGMHDATWRSSFGGSIYLGGGSHGCVNLPWDIASSIYASIEAGDPVIVY